MSAPVQIKATLKAFLPSHNSADRLLRNLSAGKHTEVAEALYFTNSDMEHGSEPWALVGEAEVTVTLKPKDDILGAQLAALQAELAQARAKALREQQAILDRISKLQALEFVGEVRATGEQSHG